MSTSRIWFPVRGRSNHLKSLNDFRLVAAYRIDSAFAPWSCASCHLRSWRYSVVLMTLEFVVGDLMRLALASFGKFPSPQIGNPSTGSRFQ